ncbi:MAG: discoidin domain-containing protein [Muribaculaceae bacterium]|nr:discoidin domain-containing protein [Muribaculaceae bacterium]
MRKILLSVAMCVSAAAFAAVPAPLGGFNYGGAAAPTGTEWEDCQNLSLNKEQPHAWFFNFATVDQAKKVLPENSPYYESLDGTWKFNWVNHPDKRPADFYKTDFDVAGWDDIAVPGCWNVQGIQKDGSLKYGKPIYVNQLVPFVTRRVPDDWRGGVMRTPPEDYTTFVDRNEVGSYRRNFTVPADWKGREVFINFDGVDSFFYLWINGQYVGFSKNSRNTASFNITKYINPKGENTVAVEVYRYSDAGMLEAQDMFRLPGIIRSTYLTSVPNLEINDLVVRTTIPADANPMGPVTAEVTVDALVRNLGKKAFKGANIDLQVYPVELYSDKAADHPVKNVKGEPVVNVKAGSVREVNIRFPLENARLWSAETPNRYVLVARLLDKKGKTIETVSTYFGVRHVEIRDTKAEDDEFGLAGRYFYVNNRPVKLKGVNRHENNLNTGHTLTREQMEQEVMLMKQGNINHVRNSHYNDDPYWYVACDKYGIYLEDEANLESHEYHYFEASLSHVPEWENAHVARNMEMVRAHVNHPSIVIWSLGNEAGPGKNFVTAYNAIKAFDSSRPVQYERNNAIVDMGSNQYPSIPWVRDAVTGKMGGLKYPFHISEYAHSMGNALGNFVDYWDAMESTNFFCGGAIWDWVDQALWNYTPDGTKYMAYGGDFGDKPNDGMFCMNGILFPDFSPKPQYHEVKRVHQYVGVKSLDPAAGTVEVFNKNYFTTLDDLQPVWSLTRNGVEVASGKDVMRPRMSVGPRESQVWSIPYDYASLDDEGEYFVTIQFLLNEDKPWAKAGYVQAEVQLPVKSPKAFAPIAATGNAPKLTVGEDVDNVAGDGFEVAFDNETGTIQYLAYGNQEIITPGNGPVLNALRAPIDNDAWDRGAWWTNGLNDLRHKVLNHKSHVRGDGAVVLMYTVESQSPNAFKIVGGGESGVYTITKERKLGPDDFKFTTEQIWTVYPDGSIELQSAIAASKPTLMLPRLGYAMTLPSNLSNYTYYGRGPVNNYNDRKTSQNIGLYKSTVADQFVPFPKPQDMGNREELRWNALTDANGNGVQFVAVDGTMSASALPWTDNEMTLAAHPYQLPVSKGTFLHIDKKVTGLGGASCGQGIALPEDRTYGRPQTFGFIIRPVVAGVDLQKQASVSANGDCPLSISRDHLGNVTIMSANPDAKIVYNVTPNGMKVARGRNGNTRNVDYTEPINMRDGGKIVAWDATNPEQVFVVNYPAIEDVPVEVINASSAEPGEGASRLTDGDESTIWHTTYGVTVALYPHWVDFDCGEEKNIKGFTYLPRRSGENGDIKDWRVEVSNDNENWTPVTSGSFERNKDLKRVEFAPVKARYFRFVALSSQNGADYASGAEFSVLAD